MFYEPIRYVPLKSLKEVMDNSIELIVTCLGNPKEFTHFQDNIVFINGRSQTFVTPLRKEITKILEDNGYKEGDYFIRSGDKEYIEKLNATINGTEFMWLKYMANEQAWNLAYQEAYKYATSKNIMTVEPEMSSIIDFECIDDDKTIDNTVYRMMMTNRSFGYSYVGTFIRAKENTVLLCDEYGRTFLVTFKYSANEFINQLIKANYTRAQYPWIFVQKLEE